MGVGLFLKSSEVSDTTIAAQIPAAKTDLRVIQDRPKYLKLQESGL
jgi:hypothetical protein